MAEHVCEARRAIWAAMSQGARLDATGAINNGRAYAVLPASLAIPCPLPVETPPGCGAAAGEACRVSGAAILDGFAALGIEVPLPDDRATPTDATPALDVSALLTLLRDLRDVGTEKIGHDYEGACPDDIEGRGTRDPRCPACVILMRADAVIGGVK